MLNSETLHSSTASELSKNQGERADSIDLEIEVYPDRECWHPSQAEEVLRRHGEAYDKNSSAGKSAGVGARFSLTQFTLEGIEPGSAADWSGVMECGDVLVSVDGCPARQVSLPQGELWGPVGSLATLVLQRDISLPEVCDSLLRNHGDTGERPGQRTGERPGQRT